jgi:hypothetical protein
MCPMKKILQGIYLSPGRVDMFARMREEEKLGAPPGLQVGREDPALTVRAFRARIRERVVVPGHAHDT